MAVVLSLTAAPGDSSRVAQHDALGESYVLYNAFSHTTFYTCLLLFLLFIGNQNGICWFEKGEGSQGFDCVPQVNMQHCLKD
jgi:hypothetical protein